MSFFQLKRVTTTGHYAPAIDGLRFLGMLYVLEEHTIQKLARRTTDVYGNWENTFGGKLAFSGWIGVEVFFALTAYIITVSLLRASDTGWFKAGHLKKYYLRRLTRITPPYYLALTLCLLVILATGFKAGNVGQFAPGESILKDYITSIFYAHNPLYGGRSKILGPAWTLELDVQFYVVLPLIVYAISVARRRWRPLALILLVASALAWVPVPSTYKHINTVFYAWPMLVGGLFLAEAEHIEAKWLPRGYLADACGLVGALLLMLQYHGWLGLGHVHYEMVGCFLALLGPLRGNLIAKLLSLPPFTFFGGMSYSIYLASLPIIELFGRPLLKIGLGAPFFVYYTWHIAVLMTLALAGSVFFFFLIERPTMVPDWPQRLYARIRGRAYTPVPRA